MVRPLYRYLVLLLIGCGSPSAPVSKPVPAPAPAATRVGPRPGDRARWEPVEGPFTAVRVRSNDTVACAVSIDGKVACWGEVEPDDDTTAVERRAGMATPHVLAGIDGAIDVVHDWFYVCVAQRPEAGEGRCFVTNDPGRAPPRFPRPPVELVPGNHGICARMRDGSVGCVDLDGTFTPASGIAGATSLSCGDDAACCAITPRGVQCFGARPPKLPKLPAVTELAFSGETGCARTTSGGAVCWGGDETKKLARPSGVRGVANERDYGMCLVLDDGALSCSDERVPAAAHARALSGQCILHDSGAVSCTGDNEHGELGLGELMLSSVPVQVPKLADVVALNVAHTNACAIKKDGSLWCWGPNGVADRGRADGPFVPAQYAGGCRNTGVSIRCGAVYVSGEWDSHTIVPKTKPIKAAAIHRDFSVCVADSKGAVQCRHGMADNGVDDRWVPLASPAPVVDLEPLATGFCARHADGRASCFLDHRYDNDDDYLDKLPGGKLELVPGITGATQLVTGQDEACVIRKDTSVWCWNAEEPKPYELPSLRGATALGANDRHACAVVRGEVWCWGDGFMGQLGDGGSTGRIEPAKTPVKAKTPFVAVKIGTGRQATCALDDKGGVWCWGANTYGELGVPRVITAHEWLRVVGIGPR